MPTSTYALLRELEGNPIPKDTRKGDRHKGKRNRKKPNNPTKWEHRNIVAWDGEGANLICQTCQGTTRTQFDMYGDGEEVVPIDCPACHSTGGYHVYNLLANSNGEHILNPEGLGTRECFDFLIQSSDPNSINVIFGGSYDINMMLKDVPREKLVELWTEHSVYWMGYRILWNTRKKFTIQRLRDARVVASMTLWDVFGFFQSSFVKACRLWLGDIPILVEIERMKGERSTFRVEDVDEIIEYNAAECTLLVMLVQRLFASLDEADLPLLRYDGAGSIAAAILRKYNITDWMGDIPADVYTNSQYAYSGGRIEAVKIGNQERGTIYRHDINSAYPAATLELPSYVGATWTYEDKWDGTNNSMVGVTYHFKEAPFYPLWYRGAEGSISYPREGRGVYWGAEIRNLFKYYQEGEDFEIEFALNCELGDDVLPFQFMKELYATRREFADRGSMASESLKLGLNSVYGKLVQQAGYREDRIPTYHHLLWGGQITAFTRARLFDVAMQFPNYVIAFATDAIFTTEPLAVGPSNKDLGGWSIDEFTGITMVQAGVYFLKNREPICMEEHEHFDSCYWGDKYRGFDKGSIDRQQVVDCWTTGEPYYASTSRFIGLGSALMANDFTIWRTWQNDKERELDIRPTGKRVHGRNENYATGLRLTRARPNITPSVLSTPYYVVWIDEKKLSDPFEETNVQTVEEQDSYL